MADEPKNGSRLKEIFNLKSGRSKAAALVAAGGIAVGGLWAAQEMSRDTENWIRVSEKQHHITRVCAEVVSERTEYGPYQVQVPQAVLDAEFERAREARVRRALERGGVDPNDTVERPQPRLQTVVGEHMTRDVRESDCREEHRYLVETKFDGTFEIAPSWLQGQFNDKVQELWNKIEPDYEYDFEMFRRSPLSVYQNITNVEDTWWTKQRKSGASNNYYNTYDY